LSEYVGVPDYGGPIGPLDELRIDIGRFANILPGYEGKRWTR
jgi:hypothetical protein